MTHYAGLLPYHTGMPCYCITLLTSTPRPFVVVWGSLLVNKAIPEKKKKKSASKREQLILDWDPRYDNDWNTSLQGTVNHGPISTMVPKCSGPLVRAQPSECECDALTICLWQCWQIQTDCVPSLTKYSTYIKYWSCYLKMTRLVVCVCYEVYQ